VILKTPDPFTIHDLRESLHNADSDAQRVIEFYQLIKHPELTWADLLECLQYRVIIQEQVAFKLHGFLGIPIPKGGPIRDQSQWLKTLEEMKIEPSEFVQTQQR